MLSPEMQTAVKLMDAYYPGWRAKVDVEKLNIGGLDTCIIGQVVPRNKELEKQHRLGRWSMVLDRFKKDIGTGGNHLVWECFASNQYQPEWIEAILG